MDYLLSEEKIEPKAIVQAETDQKNSNHFIIASMSVFLVVLIATFVFVILRLTVPAGWNLLIFAYSVPICAIVILVFNSVWFNPRHNFLIISVLMWSVFAIIFLTFFVFSINVAALFIVGIPGQIIIIMWSKLRFRSKKLFHQKRKIEKE